MLRVVFCLRRRPDLTSEEFRKYWRDVHAPLVRSHAEVLGIRRYVQTHTIDEPELHQGLQRRNGGSPEPFDGVAEVWVDDLEQMRTPSTPEGRAAAAALLDDERNFIDLSASPMWVGEELIAFG